MAVANTFGTLLLRYAARAYEKQMFLGTLIGERDWFYDMNTGKLHFGNDLEYNMQLIGSEGEASNTWLWAWANTNSDIPPQLLVAAQTIKAYGEQNNIPALTMPHMTLNEHYNGHYLAMVSGGIYKANAYYRAPYQGGALYLLIEDSEFPADKRHPVERIALLFPQAVSHIPIADHKTMFTGYLASYDMVVKSEAGKVRGIYPEDRAEVTAEFDANNRLTTIGNRMA